jgi:hypothetical protein
VARGGGNGLLGLEYLDLRSSRMLGADYKNTTGNFVVVSGAIGLPVEYLETVSGVHSEFWNLNGHYEYSENTFSVGVLTWSSVYTGATLTWIGGDVTGLLTIVYEVVSESNPPTTIRVNAIQTTLNPEQQTVGEHTIVLGISGNLASITVFQQIAELSGFTIKQIFVETELPVDDVEVSLSVDGVVLQQEIGERVKFFAIVPPGSVCRVESDGRLLNWVELQ